MKLINIGFGNIVFANRLIAIVSPESAPVKRLVQDARDRGMLIDATYGRRTRAVLIMDSDHVILSAIQPETVANRLNTQEGDHIMSENWHENDVGESRPEQGFDSAGSARGRTRGEFETAVKDNPGEQKPVAKDSPAGNKKSGGRKSGAEGSQKRRDI